MIRAFIALPLPEEVRTQLAVVQQMLPLPRRIPSEDMHLTLVFLGEQPEPVLQEVHGALETVRANPFEMRLSGLAHFGGMKPRIVYAGVVPCEALMQLQSKVENSIRRIGVEVEAKRFVPHVTLGRLRIGEIQPAHLEHALVACAGFSAGPFTVDRFTLYESRLGPKGPRYDELAEYPLRTGD
ncbi:MAG: RNA 2',3'-cyclic phosphodiesterase [Rhodobacteraceae bacterium]|nr:RNA 2',3'-cyclic phosphodiesterase [Paracoccaceae bacterium]